MDYRTPVVRIKHPAHPDGVLINKADFDEDEHELHGDDTSSMSAGPKTMKVAEMRALLKERGVAIPDGAKKADLQALVDDLN